MNKKSMWEDKKNSRFLSTGHGRILEPSCGCKACETMVAKCELVQSLMGALEQSLVEYISLQRSNCNIFGLTDTVALFAKEARFFKSDLGCSSGHVLSKTKSVTPYFFCLFGKTRSLPFCEES